MRSRGMRIVMFIALLIAVAAADHIADPALDPGVDMDVFEEEQFTRQERRWAARWVNRSLETLMAHGVIETIAGADGQFQVRAGDAWRELSFRQAGELLQNLSRAREISGNSPFFSVEDGSSGATIGRVGEDAITLLLPGEGLFEYVPDTSGRKNTVY